MTETSQAQSDAAPSNPDIQVETEETGAIQRSVRVQVDKKRVRKAFDRTYKELARNVSVKGFRKGKVPRSVLEKMYAASIPDEIERLLIQETAQDAIDLSGVMPVAEPEIEAGRPDPESAFEYTLKLEIMPTVELPDLGEVEAQKPKVEVPDSDIDAELTRLQEQNAPLVEEPEDARVAEGTTVTFDYEGRIDGELFDGGKAEGVDLEIGSGRMIPGFEDGLVGAAAGGALTVKVTFPEEYGVDELNGKDAEFSCTVHSLRRKQTPELDDEFAKDLGDYDTLDALREKIRGDITGQRENEAQQVLQRSLLDSLIAKTDFEVPTGVVERQIEAQINSMRQQFGNQLPPDMLETQLARMRDEGRPAAERRVRESYILNAVSTSENLSVEAADVDARLEEMAEMQGADVKEIKHMAEHHGWKDSIESELLDKKALELIESRARIEETSEPEKE